MFSTALYCIIIQIFGLPMIIRHFTKPVLLQNIFSLGFNGSLNAALSQFI